MDVKGYSKLMGDDDDWYSWTRRIANLSQHNSNYLQKIGFSNFVLGNPKVVGVYAGTLSARMVHESQELSESDY